MTGGAYCLQSVLDCSPEQASAVRRLRNLPEIRGAMYGDQVISEAEHAAWLAGLKGDARRKVLVVLDSFREPVGVVSLTAIDRVHRRADWGFYMGPAAPRGLGACALTTLMDHAFDDLALEKVNGEVIEGNDASLALHRKLGFRDEGRRRSHVQRVDGRLDVHLLGLTAGEWRAARGAIRAGLAAHTVRLEAGS
ncbi:MAG: UDP-4-amino-4,6-dideoxy-N-acetyl-beta-L-altrosamine N-acetyltransferase [Phenylobacterium sp.]|nr:UDP-4-amino-4,6-dideoxy-N-acetyl-beta-L-altrosamine N-acetyltransferase [Phenylobacterium sp.]